MSRGLGRIERAIRTLFAADPDMAYTTEDVCAACYPGANEWKVEDKLHGIELRWGVERKHRVAVLRAAKKLIASDPDWRCRSSWFNRGNMLVFYNAASPESTAIAQHLTPHCTTERARERARWARGCKQRADTETGELDRSIRWGKEDWEQIERKVARHVALRDAPDPVERERLTALYEAEGAKYLAEMTGAIKTTLGR